MNSSLSQVVARAVERVKRTASGARILAEWLGEGGKPVDRTVAQDRIDVCLRCVHNKPTQAASIEKTVAEAIIEQEQVRNDMSMILYGEGNAGTCDVCGCYLKLKVWVPIKHLDSSGMPDSCWISRESKSV
ncbi:MAG: hypothetical protein EBR48_04900 [bacterium]|jgi:ferredoxin|nr:hypothetical protein [Candidatus Aquidulcis frankliniae]